MASERLAATSSGQPADESKQHLSELEAWDSSSACWAGGGANMGFSCPAPCQGCLLLGPVHSAQVSRPGHLGARNNRPRRAPAWSAGAENSCRRPWWTFRLSLRKFRTSLNALVVSFKRPRRLSTTVCEWLRLCTLDSRDMADSVCRSARPALRFWISSLMALLRSLISSAGSSNMDVRLASWDSLNSFWEVAWMPCPIQAARLENSDCCAARLLAVLALPAQADA